MPDQFTTTSTTGYGSKIVNSISGVIFGLLLFVGSFVVLYLNEGRVDLSSIAKTAVEISSATVNADSSLNGKLVSATGIVSSTGNIGDNLFLNPGNYIAVERKVEMYSWVETKNTTTHNNTGGSSTTSTTYSYKKDWEENPADSSTFNYPDGHQNPGKSLDSYTNRA
ncbi:MAG: TMEM43 family protein, partial [Candidatus Staskawiczbacteria bacterium]